MEQQTKRKTKVLYVGDYNRPTGFGEVSKNLLHRWMNDDEFEFTVLACNYNGQSPVYPAHFPVYACHSDYALNEIAHVFDIVQPDILITLNDGYVMPSYVRQLGARLNNCWWIGYVVFDGTPIARWREALKHIDLVVFPTEWQAQEMAKVMPDFKCAVVSHGVNLDVYKPVEKTGIKQYKMAALGEKNADAFIFGMIAKNFERKRYPELIQAFAIFKYKSGIEFKRNPMLMLYQTTERGEFNLENLAKIAGCKDGDVAIITAPDNQGLTDNEMNLLYNSFDVNCLISIGEGFGLPTINAAACGKLTMAMNNSVQPSLAKYFPMYLVPCDNQSPVWFGKDMEQIRFIPDCKKLAQAMCEVYVKMNEPGFAEQIAKEAMTSAKEFTWDIMADDFMSLVKPYVGQSKKAQVI